MSDSDFTIRPEGEAAVIAQMSFGAKPEALRRALTDPEMLAKWMGAPEAPLKVCEVDARPGGRFRLAWAFPDGTQAWSAGVFETLAEDRIGHTEAHRPDWTGGETRVVKQIRAHEGRTWLRQATRFSGPMARGAALGSMAPGVQASWARLAEVLKG
ncbi:MAG TPA: SRPBCC domain-containing protein [Paracoccaceae bacterium]|nr:SRPBCC domain-containing protein [Paracoccaceae bacterium]HMO72136.1 SRPBCC domain-containing protein [Paracoccaceae bacterium]